MSMRPSLIVLLLIGASPAALAAQSAPPPAPASQARGAVPPAGDEGDEEEEQQITVTGTPRPLPGAVIGDIPPELQLGPADIRSYGVSTVTDLLAELAPEIGSGQGRGGEQPVVLLNGHRISGLRELRDVPTEAILRVDILPEEVALRYGYSATQKVVNIVLRRRFRAVTLEATAGTGTAGGARTDDADRSSRQAWHDRLG